MRDRRVARNIWQTRFGWRVLLRTFDLATGRMRRTARRFKHVDPRLGGVVTLDLLEEYRDTVQLETRRLRRQWRKQPHAAQNLTTTFTDDARRYLALEVVQAMPSYSTRTIEIEKWITLFGDQVRATMTPMHITAQLQRLKNEGYSGSTVNKFRTALMSLWTQLDGRSAANPVKDTILFEEAELVPRGQRYELLERILACIPDAGVVERTRLYGEVWREPLTVVAPRYGVSDSFLHRICRTLQVPTPPRGYWTQTAAARRPRPPLPPAPTSTSTRVPEAAKHRARLEVLAWTGMDPSQLQRMGPTHIRMLQRQYVTPHRRKGSRRRTTPRPVIPKPMTQEAAQAFQRLIDLGLLGQPFDAGHLRRAWVRAQRALEAQLRCEYHDPLFTLPHIRLKDIRHSYGTKLYEELASVKGERGALEIVGQMLDHRPGSPMTLRYALGAVPDALQRHVSQFPQRVVLPPKPNSDADK